MLMTQTNVFCVRKLYYKLDEEQGAVYAVIFQEKAGKTVVIKL